MCRLHDFAQMLFIIKNYNLISDNKGINNLKMDEYFLTQKATLVSLVLAFRQETRARGHKVFWAFYTLWPGIESVIIH